MLNPKNPIGVIDSGVGGFTVVKEIQKLLPNENIVYIGDSKNCPYGNKSKTEILNLTKNMLDFLKEQNVKTVAIACNTISSALNGYENDYDFNIVSIIHPAVDYVNAKGINEIGLLATEFTVQTGYYTRLLTDLCENIKVFTQSSPKLASLIDNTDFNNTEIDSEINTQIGKLLENSSGIENIILACTHYPIIIESFKKHYPNINFINPAYQQAVKIMEYLKSLNLLNTENNAYLKVYTTGNKKSINEVCKKLDINLPDEICNINLL